MQSEEVVTVLGDVCVALEDSKRRMDVALDEARRLQREELAGASHAACLQQTSGPLIVTVLRSNLLALQEVGHRLRVVEVEALHRDGATTTEIAKLLGISRQRAGALLHANHNGRRCGEAS